LEYLKGKDGKLRPPFELEPFSIQVDSELMGQIRNLAGSKDYQIKLTKKCTVGVPCAKGNI
jgi:hypothetical protein